MQATSWGPKGWGFIHAASFGYPDDPTEADRQSAYHFVRGIAGMLPCTICRQHFAELCAAIDGPAHPVFRSRDALARFFVDCHNDVNRRLDKTEYRFEAIAARYLASSSKCPPSVARASGSGALVVALLVAAIAAYVAVATAMRRRCVLSDTPLSAPACRSGRSDAPPRG